MLLYAFWSLVSARVFPAVFLGPRIFFETFSAYSLQFEVGAAVVLACAWFGAPRLAGEGSRAFTEPVALAVSSFVAGAFVACWANFLLAGGQSERHGLSSYVIKPFFWLVLFGVPASFLVGAVLSWRLNRKGQ